MVYEFPFSDLAPLAGGELESAADRADRGGLEPLSSWSSDAPSGCSAPSATRRRVRCSRACAAARATATTASSWLLRLAECDYFLKRPRNARDGVRPYIDKAARQGEALFFYAVATRDLGDHDGVPPHRSPHRRRVPDAELGGRSAEQPRDPLHPADDDEKADETFRELYEKFPTGHYAERAAWKIGWWAYRNGRYADTVRVFESAAAQFPALRLSAAVAVLVGRGARSAAGPALAEARFTLVATDYLNSYYGRLAVARLERRDRRRGSRSTGQRIRHLRTTPGRRVRRCRRTKRVVRALLALDLYDQALDELHYAQKVWGDSSAIQATIGWIFNQRGDLRAGINAMKRAYPQYMAAGGEKLPPELLKVLFPVELLAADPALFGRAPARSVHDRGADRAGVDVHGGRQVGRQRLRADAAAAVHRPPVRAACCSCRGSSRSAC